MRTHYQKLQFADREFMRPIGKMSFHFLARSPQPTQNYLTLISPYDNYVWYLLGSSVVAISVSLTAVDIVYAKFTKTSTKGVLIQSMQNHPT